MQAFDGVGHNSKLYRLICGNGTKGNKRDYEY